MIDRPGGIFVRRAEQIAERGSRRCCRRWRASIARATPRDARRAARARAGAADAAGRRACKPIATASRPSRRRRRDAAAPRDLAASTAWAASRRDGREYVITTAARARDARALGQRARQPVLRHRRHRERQRLHLVRERARVPPDALAQRSGRATRAARRSTCATRRRPRSGRRRRCPRRGAIAVHRRRHGFGYSVFEHTDGGIASELCDLRRDR